MLVRLDRTSTDGAPALVVVGVVVASRTGDFKHSSSSSIKSCSEFIVDDTAGVG